MISSYPYCSDRSSVCFYCPISALENTNNPDNLIDAAVFNTYPTQFAILAV